MFSEVLDEDYRASNNFNGVPLLYEPKSISGIYLESAILIVSTKTLCFRSKATSCLPWQLVNRCYVSVVAISRVQMMHSVMGEIEALADYVDVVIEKPRTPRRMAHRWHSYAVLWSECFLSIHWPLSYAIRPTLSSWENTCSWRLNLCPWDTSAGFTCLSIGPRWPEIPLSCQILFFYMSDLI